MDFARQWQELKTVSTDAAQQAQRVAVYEAFLQAMAAESERGNQLLPGDAEGKQQFATALRRVCSGNVVAVGPLPQLELCLLAALWFIAEGKRVIVLPGMPVDTGTTRDLVRSLARELKLEAKVVGPVFGNAVQRLKDSLRADLILCDYGQLISELFAKRDLFRQRPTVALFCEIDLCLYDGRLGLFDAGNLQAVAAIYHATGKPLPWEDQIGVLDFRDAAAEFDMLGGVTSCIPPLVTRELTTVYGPQIKGKIRSKGGSSFPSLVFRTLQDKGQFLAKRISETDGDSLVFYCQDATRRAVTEELRQWGCAAMPLAGNRALYSFLSSKGTKKRVGFFPSMPSLLMPVACEQPPRINLIVAEHFLFDHHHAKLRVFGEKYLDMPSKPLLCFSLEDELFLPYAEQFSRSFDLIEFTERYDKFRQVRRVMARSMLRKVHRLRRMFLTEEYPVFTSVSPRKMRDKKAGKMRKKIGKQLDSLCFCGSGELFKDCHGDAKRG